MSGPGFKDHFSGVAGAYAAARPEYPDTLFDAIAAHVPSEARVWEAGCGSGQATRGLAARFAHVHATDPSAAQIAQHWARDGAAPNVTLAVEPGERTAQAGGSAGLVCVAQALHWFDRAVFFAECERVLAPGGVLAAWGYGDIEPPEPIAAPMRTFAADIASDWPPERALVDARYAGFNWPFAPLPSPALSLTAEWTLPRLLGYLSSYSATARHRARTGIDPVAAHRDAIASAWGDPDAARTLRWPLFLHLRRNP